MRVNWVLVREDVSHDLFEMTFAIMAYVTKCQRDCILGLVQIWWLMLKPSLAQILISLLGGSMRSLTRRVLKHGLETTWELPLWLKNQICYSQTVHLGVE